MKIARCRLDLFVSAKIATLVKAVFVLCLVFKHFGSGKTNYL